MHELGTDKDDDKGENPNILNDVTCEWPQSGFYKSLITSQLSGGKGSSAPGGLPGLPPALASLFAAGDPSKLGPAEYSQFLQFYEKQLKAATEATQAAKAKATAGAGMAAGRGATASPAASSTNSTASSTVSKVNINNLQGDPEVLGPGLGRLRFGEFPLLLNKVDGGTSQI